jgi:hypothetical protein
MTDINQIAKGLSDAPFEDRHAEIKLIAIALATYHYPGVDPDRADKMPLWFSFAGEANAVHVAIRTQLLVSKGLPND